jgi:hypothetical protein
MVFYNYFISNDENPYKSMLGSNTLIIEGDWGTRNLWNKSDKGNFWSDYSGEDLNNDGIGDSPYNISGSAESKDHLPIWNDGPTIEIRHPINNDVFAAEAPSFTVIITSEYQVEESSYSLNGKTQTFNENGTINQDLWNNLTDGFYTLNFSARDTTGKLNWESIGIYKDVGGANIVIHSPTPGAEYANAPYYNITITVDVGANIIGARWYTVANGQDISCSTSGNIDQGEWDSQSDGEVTITFYVNDSTGTINSKSVTVIKKTTQGGGGLISGFPIVITAPIVIAAMIVLVLRYQKKRNLNLS